MSSKATINFYTSLMKKGQIVESKIPEDIRPIVMAKVKDESDENLTVISETNDVGKEPSGFDKVLEEIFSDDSDDDDECDGNCEECAAKLICSAELKETK